MTQQPACTERTAQLVSYARNMFMKSTTGWKCFCHRQTLEPFFCRSQKGYSINTKFLLLRFLSSVSNESSTTNNFPDSNGFRKVFSPIRNSTGPPSSSSSGTESPVERSISQMPIAGNTKGGSITALLTSCLTGFESAV